MTDTAIFPLPAADAGYAELVWTGIETSFNPNIRAENVAHVGVSFVDSVGAITVLTRGVHFGISLGGDGAVTLTPIALPAAPGTLVVERATPADQQTDFGGLSAFGPSIHTKLHTRAALRDAELARRTAVLELAVETGTDAAVTAAAAGSAVAAAASAAAAAVAEAEVLALVQSISFPTVIAARAATISASFGYLSVEGYSAVGDGGSASYHRVGSEPAHAGKLQSADGAWWEIYDLILRPQMFGDPDATLTNAQAVAAAQGGRAVMKNNALYIAAATIAGLLTATTLTVAPAAASAQLAINTVQSGALSGVPTQQYFNQISITADAYDASGFTNPEMQGVKVAHVFGGMAMRGRRHAFVAEAILAFNSSASNTTPDLVGGVFRGVAGANMGGGLGTEWGAVFGINPIIYADVNATNFSAYVGSESDISVINAAKYHFGHSSVKTNAPKALTLDVAFEAGAVTNTGWEYLAYASSVHGRAALSTTASLLGADAMTIANGIYGTNLTITGYFLLGPGGKFSVDGPGNIIGLGGRNLAQTLGTTTTYNQFFDSAGNAALILGGGGASPDAVSYYENTSHKFYTINAGTLLATIDATAVNAKATTAATSTTTGALISGGGLGVAGAGWFGSTLNAPSLSLNAGGAALLTSDAAEILAQRNGVNAQEQRWYNTFTDASNYERGSLGWKVNANWLTLRSTNAGTGAARGIVVDSATSILAFNGITSSFPALKRNAATFDARLADDSAYASMRAAFFDAATAASGFKLNGTITIKNDGTYTYLADPSGTFKFFFGNATDATNYYRQTLHLVQSIDGLTTFGQFSATGLGVAPTTASTSTTTGAITTGGGIGVAGAAWIGGLINGASTIQGKSGTATPSGGTQVLLMGSAGVAVCIGTGVPTLSAPKGSIYINATATTTTTRFYINTDGGTTWTNFTTAA